MNAREKEVLIQEVVGEVGYTICEVMNESPEGVWKLAFARQIGKVIESERKEEEYLRCLVRVREMTLETDNTAETIVEEVGKLVGSVLQGEEG